MLSFHLLWHSFQSPSPIYLRLSENFDLLKTFALETHWKLFPETPQQRTCWPVFRLNTAYRRLHVLHFGLERSAIWQIKLNWQVTFLWNVMPLHSAEKKSQTRYLKKDNTGKTENHLLTLKLLQTCFNLFFYCWIQNKMLWIIFVAGRSFWVNCLFNKPTAKCNKPSQIDLQRNRSK